MEFCCAEDGTWKGAEVEQPGSGLIWTVCAIGQVWIEGASCRCSGTSTTFQWCDAAGVDAPGYCTASEAGVDICQRTFSNSGYRLPSREEYVEMLGNCPATVLNGNSGVCNTCLESDLCTSLFGSDNLYYWSGTPHNESEAWLIFFDLGAVGNHRKDAWANVRCVRAVP